MKTSKQISVYILMGIIVSMVLMGATMVNDKTNPSAIKKKILSIPAAAFTEQQWVSDWNIERTGGFLRSFPTNTFQGVGRFNAPVVLPDGIKIYEIRIYAKNNDMPSVDLSLVRNTPDGGSNKEFKLASVNVPSHSGPDIIKKAIFLRVPHKVSNDGACYSLKLYLPDSEGNDVAFHHAEIVYTGKKW